MVWSVKFILQSFNKTKQIILKLKPRFFVCFFFFFFWGGGGGGGGGGGIEGRMKNKQNILCLNTMQLSTYPPNKTMILGTQLVGVEFVGAELVGAESVRGRVR